MELTIGNRYSRDDIQSITGKGFANVNPGICRRVDENGNPYGILFATSEGQYDNEISDKGRFSYMGEGKQNQEFKENYPQCGNCFLRDSIQTDYPIYFFYRKTKKEKFEYRGQVSCRGYEIDNSGGTQRIMFKLEYEEYPEGLPSPTPNELRNFSKNTVNHLYKDMSESDLRSDVLDLFVYETLGWNNANTSEEYRVKIGSQHVRADYAFVKEDSVKCLVEAKNPRERLDKHIEQLSSYMKLTDCPFGLLTNGSEWIMLALSQSGQPLEQTSLFNISIDNIEEQDLFVLIHQSTLLEEESEELARKIGEYKSTIRHIEENQEDYISNMIDKLPRRARDRAKENLEMAFDDIISNLEDDTPVVGRPEINN